MARITIDDCLDNVDNRFKLVLIASKRTRKLISGECVSDINIGNDKFTVVSLKEISKGKNVI